MLGVLICVLAVLLPLGAPGPIVTPEGIVQTYGIKALFGREAEFGIEPTPRGPELESSSPNPAAQLGLLQPLEEAVVLKHGSQGRSVSLQGPIGAPESRSSFVPHAPHGSQVSPTFLGHSDPHPHEGSVSQRTKKLHGSLASYDPYGSHISKRIQGSYNPHQPYRSQSLSPGSLGSSRQTGSYSTQKHHSPVRRVVLIRKGRQAEPVPSRSDTLLSGIISDIRKDLLNLADIGSFNPQPSRRVIIFSDPDTPTRSDGLLTGIISGIKKDIFVEEDLSSSPSPPSSPSTLASNSLLRSPSSPSPPIPLAPSSPSPNSSPLPSSSPSDITSPSPTSPSPPQSSSPEFSSISSSLPPSSSRVISLVQLTPAKLSSNTPPPSLLSTSPLLPPVTTSLAPTPPSNLPLVSSLPSSPPTPLPSSSSENEERHFPERSTDLLKGILTGIRRDIFSSSSSNFRNGGRTPENTVRERRTILETFSEALA